jgi:FdhD protein
MSLAMTTPPDWSVETAASAWRDGWAETRRTLAEETAIAITYNRVTHAVMMATPADLHDFAVGFSLSEDIIPAPGAIEDFQIVQAERGIELRLWIGAGLMGGLEARRRVIAGATGCGMCGLESLEAAMRPLPAVPPDGTVFSPAQIMAAVASLAPSQALGQATRAVHAAGFWRHGTGLVALREDVGRHNALDKLGGALALAGEAPGKGVLVLTSRISIELVQKAARRGASVVAAVSAPTALAVRSAEQAGLTLVGVARPDGFELFCGHERII